jgi:large subunit ribosomal protein L25
MAQTVTLGAARRSDAGKGAARQLRLSGRIPAVIYGHGREPESLSLGEKELEYVLKGLEVGSALFDLDVDGTPVKALVREIQRHPFRAKILHVDFLEIHAGEKITVQLAFTSPARPTASGTAAACWIRRCATSRSGSCPRTSRTGWRWTSPSCGWGSRCT